MTAEKAPLNDPLTSWLSSLQSGGRGTRVGTKYMLLWQQAMDAEQSRTQSPYTGLRLKLPTPTKYRTTYNDSGRPPEELEKPPLALRSQSDSVCHQL
jgi:hypothetical protein